MSMVISTNMSALNTTNQLNKNSSLMNSSLEKLSSGYSINSAADDASGLAISEKMRAQIQGLDQASSNSQDAISLTQTADGSLDETNSILKRMRELAVKASSETLTDSDRDAVQDEVDQLRQEIDRISNDTEFNTKKLLNGDSGTATSVSGTNSDAIVATSTVAGNNTTSGTYEVKYTSVATQAETGLATSTTGINSTTDSASAFAGDITINGTTITVASTDTIEGVLKKINDESGTTGVTATIDTADINNQFIKLTANDYGSDSEITIAADNTTLTGLFNATTDQTTTSITVNGTDAAGTINGAAAAADGNTLTAFDLTVTGDDDALKATSVDYNADQLSAALAEKNTVAASSANTALTANVAANTALKTAITNTTTSTATDTFAAAIKTATAAATGDTVVDTATKAAVTTAYTAYQAAIDSGDAESIVNTKANLTSTVATLGDATLTGAQTAYNTATGTALNTAATTVLSTEATLQADVAAVTTTTISSNTATDTDDTSDLATLIADATNSTALTTLGTAITGLDVSTVANLNAATTLNNAYNAYSTALASGNSADIVSTLDTLTTAATDYDTAATASGTATGAVVALGTYTGAGTIADIDTTATTVSGLISTALAAATNSAINTDYSNYTDAVAKDARGSTASATVTVKAATNLTFQVGANSGQTMTLSIDDMDANALGVAGTSTTAGIDLSTADKATTAISTIDAAISKVASARSNLGAVQNSLESNINNLDTESENLSSAESNIRDTDMASEMAEYTKLSVITQAATAMLAKANQQPQQVLTLLQG